jgi:hypothetical protein
MIFEANMAGVDLKKEMSKADKETGESAFMFKAPEEYERLSEDERKKMTERMLNFHKTKLG